MSRYINNYISRLLSEGRQFTIRLGEKENNV